MSEFRKRVYQVVSKIQKGRIMTYKEVAEAAGFPRAWRAAGNVLNKNRSSKVPCHRVIRSDGKVGGYRGGTKKKIMRLKKEGINIKKSKIWRKNK